MKKLTSLALALALTVSMSAPVFAADNITSTDTDNSASRNITVNYTPTESREALIDAVSVDVDGITYAGENTAIVRADSTTVTITVSGDNLDLLTSENKITVASGKSDEDLSTWTTNDANTTASKTFDASYFTGCTTAYSINYKNQGESSYTASGMFILYVANPVSIDITWGSMNFTYSEEQVGGSEVGWTCDTGANIVKVENKGYDTVTATLSYTTGSNNALKDVNVAIDGYNASSIEKNVAKDSTVTFTVTLSGKPSSKVEDATLGSLTLTIGKYTASND